MSLFTIGLKMLKFFGRKKQEHTAKTYTFPLYKITSNTLLEERVKRLERAVRYLYLVEKQIKKKLDDSK